jgi:hypothetical protein
VIGGKTTDLKIGVQTPSGENATSTEVNDKLRTDISDATLTGGDSTQEPPPPSESTPNQSDDAASSQIIDAQSKMIERKRAGRPKKFHGKQLNKKVGLKSGKSRTHSKITYQKEDAY